MVYGNGNKPVTAMSQFNLDRHDDKTTALTIDGEFAGYVTKRAAQLIRCLDAQLDEMRSGFEAIRRENAQLLAQVAALTEVATKE